MEHPHEDKHAEVMGAIGEIKGKLDGQDRVLVQIQRGIDTQLQGIRDQIKTLDANHSRRMDDIEDTLENRMDAMELNVDKSMGRLSERVSHLETENDHLSKQVTKNSMITGGMGAALALAASEILKKFIT